MRPFQGAGQRPAADGAAAPSRDLRSGCHPREDPLAPDRRPASSPLFNGFIWRFLFDAAILRDNAITFEGAYLEDELFLMEYFSNARRLAVTDRPLYRYLENPASATHRYMPDYLQVFQRFLERKAAIVEKYGLSAARPQWRADTVWAGLLIAVGNEYAKSNPKSPGEKQKAVEADLRPAGICQSNPGALSQRAGTQQAGGGRPDRQRPLRNADGSCTA